MFFRVSFLDTLFFIIVQDDDKKQDFGTPPGIQVGLKRHPKSGKSRQSVLQIYFWCFAVCGFVKNLRPAFVFGSFSDAFYHFSTGPKLTNTQGTDIKRSHWNSHKQKHTQNTETQKSNTQNTERHLHHRMAQMLLEKAVSW